MSEPIILQITTEVCALVPKFSAGLQPGRDAFASTSLYATSCRKCIVLLSSFIEERKKDSNQIRDQARKVIIQATKSSTGVMDDKYSEAGKLARARKPCCNPGETSTEGRKFDLMM